MLRWPLEPIDHLEDTLEYQVQHVEPAPHGPERYLRMRGQSGPQSSDHTFIDRTLVQTEGVSDPLILVVVRVLCFAYPFIPIQAATRGNLPQCKHIGFCTITFLNAL